MTTLYMDVEGMRAAVDRLMNDYNTLLELSRSMDVVVSEMELSWIANSEIEFYNAYIEIKKTLIMKLNAISSLADRLSTEIDDWEQAASKLAPP